MHKSYSWLCNLNLETLTLRLICSLIPLTTVFAWTIVCRRIGQLNCDLPYSKQVVKSENEQLLMVELVCITSTLDNKQLCSVMHGQTAVQSNSMSEHVGGGVK